MLSVSVMENREVIQAGTQIHLHLHEDVVELLGALCGNPPRQLPTYDASTGHAHREVATYIMKQLPDGAFLAVNVVSTVGGPCRLTQDRFAFLTRGRDRAIATIPRTLAATAITVFAISTAALELCLVAGRILKTILTVPTK